MKMLNRSALRLRARPAFIEWCASVAIENVEELAVLKSQLEQTGSVYLIDEAQSEDDFTAAIASGAKAILKNELSAWCIDQTLWPELLDSTRLEQWFTISVELMAFDLAQEPLLIADTDQLDDGEIIESF